MFLAGTFNLRVPVKFFAKMKMSTIFALAFRAVRKDKFRAISSAGSEHLPYKQRVGGSNPSSPTALKPGPHTEPVLFLKTVLSLLK